MTSGIRWITIINLHWALTDRVLYSVAEEKTANDI